MTVLVGPMNLNSPCGPGPYCASVAAKAWWRADDLSLANNDPVSTWTDRTGNGYDMTQSGSARPAFKTSILGSMPVVRFDGVSDWMSSSLVSSLTSGWTMIVVAKAGGGGFKVPFHNGDIDGSATFYAHDGYGIATGTDLTRFGALVGGVGFASGADATDTSWHILGLYRDTVFELTKDGGGYDLANTLTPITPTNGTYLGAHPSFPAVWDGDIAEAMFFEDVLGHVDWNLIGNELASRWGLSWTDVTTP